MILSFEFLKYYNVKEVLGADFGLTETKLRKNKNVLCFLKKSKEL